MSPVIAKGDLGPCCGCGVHIERGEWATFYGKGPAHVGCAPRPKLDEVGCEKGESTASLIGTLAAESLRSAAELKRKVKSKSGKLDQPRPEKTRAREGQVAESGYLFSEAETVTIENAQEVLGVKRILFDGATVLQIDTPRLATQFAKVFELMRDGKYRTLAQIAGVAGCLETSASARLRDLRKARFGSHDVISRQVAGSPLLFEYRLIINKGKEIDGQQRSAA